MFSTFPVHLEEIDICTIHQMHDFLLIIFSQNTVDIHVRIMNNSNSTFFRNAGLDGAGFVRPMECSVVFFIHSIEITMLTLGIGKMYILPATDTNVTIDRASLLIGFVRHALHGIVAFTRYPCCGSTAAHRHRGIINLFVHAHSIISAIRNLFQFLRILKRELNTCRLQVFVVYWWVFSNLYDSDSVQVAFVLITSQIAADMHLGLEITWSRFRSIRMAKFLIQCACRIQR
mmetsp:Transcript_17508/g.26180  ORF Transcript_17508/g.26180 Transcript_17508/m.26180 type:complete len:231 (+) Transcript_17508:555-1247(+)